MLIVAINTASKDSAIALISSEKVLVEESWRSNANESAKILPGLTCLLKEAGKSWEDVGGVFVVKGPGSYTSLRMGITIANAIAWTRKIPLWTTDLETLETSCLNSSKTFGKSVASLNWNNLEKTDQAIPLYAAPPNITQRKK